MAIKDSECVLLKTKDDRSFLTELKNYNSILEFAAATGASIFKVQNNSNNKILDLKTLIQRLCTNDVEEISDYSVLEKLFPKNQENSIPIKETKSTKTPEKPLLPKRVPRMITKIVLETIESMFLEKEIVSEATVLEKLRKSNITNVRNVYQNIMKVKRALQSGGLMIKKLSPGKYQA